MNPENMGEHISLRHSSLWRKPLQYDRPTPNASACHHQLNQRTPAPTQPPSPARTGAPATTPSNSSPPPIGAAHPSHARTIPANSEIC